MPNFMKPFCCDVQTLTELETRKALLQSMSDEYEAAQRYLEIAEACDDEEMKKIFEDIAKEEYVHAGEFRLLLEHKFPCILESEQEGTLEATGKLSGEEKKESKQRIRSQLKKKFTLIG